MPFAEVLLIDLYDKDHPVNGVRTDVNGVLIRDRWDQVATVRVVDHPADSLDTPALFTNTARFETWRLGKAKLGTATILYDMSGVDIVIPGAEQSINPDIPPPVTNFITGVTTPFTIDLHWDSSLGNGDFQGYHLEQQILGVDPDYRRIASLGQTAVAFIARDLPPDSFIRFRIRTYQTLIGLWANTDGVTDIDAEETLPPITSGEILNVDPATQNLEWSYDEGENPENFRIEYAITGEDTVYQPLVVVDGDTSSYQVESLPSDRLVFYRIRAETDDETSIWQSDSETTLPDVALDLPVWDSIPPLTIEVSTLPFEYDVSGFVTSSTTLVNWRYSPNIEYISISDEGILQFTDELLQSINVILISVDNDDGTGTSEQFQIEIDDVDESDKEIQVTDNFNRSNRLLSSDGLWGPSVVFLRIHNEELIQNSPDEQGFAFYEHLATFRRNYAQVRIVNPPGQSDQWMGVKTRFSSSDWPVVANSYTFLFSNDRVQIRYYWSVYDFVILAETSATIQRGDIFLGSSIDNIHEIFINGHLVLAVEDPVWNPILCFNGLLSDNPDQDGVIDDYESGIPLRVPSVPPLTPVENFQIDGKSTNWIRLEWRHIGSLDHFRLERFVLGTDTDWQVLEENLDPQVRIYDDTGLASETVHIYRIRTERSNGEFSTWVEVEDETDSDDSLNDVYDFETTNHDFTTLDLEWKYDGTGNTGFTLHILEDGTYVSLGGEDDPSVRIRNVTDLNPDTLYEFRMRAYDVNGGSAWQFTSGRTDSPDVGETPEWITVPNFVTSQDDLPLVLDMNTYVSSDTDITGWSIPNYSGVSIDSGGILTITIEGDWTFRVTATNQFGSSDSNAFSISIGDVGDVHYAPTRFPLRIVNPRPLLDIPGPHTSHMMKPWSRYRHTHSQVRYEVPIGCNGGRPPFQFSISGSSNFTIAAQAPDWNPGMTTYALVSAAAGDTGTYTVTVTDMDGESQSVNVTVNNDDDRFIFIAPDGDDGNDGSFGSPIQTCQEWYGNSGVTASDYIEKIIVYRAGTYALPTDPTAALGQAIVGHAFMPVVHMKMPDDAEVILTGDRALRNGFKTNTGSSQPTNDTWWEGFTFECNGLMGSVFRHWSGAHRHMWWKLKYLHMNGAIFDESGTSNYGGAIYLSSGSNWGQSNISMIDCTGEDWAGTNNNHCMLEAYGAIHLHVDDCRLINCTNGPGEAFFLKSESVFCSLTSIDTWFTPEWINRFSRSHVNWAPGLPPGAPVSEDYGWNWWESPNQVRYCRFYQNPANHEYQNMRLVHSSQNRVCCKTWMDRTTLVGWCDSSTGDGVGTNPETGGQIPPELDRSFYFANNPWGTYQMPAGYIKTNSVEAHYRDLPTYLNEPDGKVLDPTLQYQIGYQVPLVAATKFFGDLDEPEHPLEEDDF